MMYMKMPRFTNSEWKSFMTSKFWENLSPQVRKCFYSVLTCTYSQVSYALDGLILFIVHTIFPHRVIEIKDPKNDVTFKSNGQRLKPYLKYQPHGDDIEINLSDSPNLNWDFSFFSVI